MRTVSIATLGLFLVSGTQAAQPQKRDHDSLAKQALRKPAIMPCASSGRKSAIRGDADEETRRAQVPEDRRSPQAAFKSIDAGRDRSRWRGHRQPAATVAAEACSR